MQTTTATCFRMWKRQAYHRLRKAARHKLAEQRELNQLILQSLMHGIMITDAGDVIIETSPNMVRMAGVPREQIVGTHILNGFPEATLQNFRPLYLQARASLTPVFINGIEVVTPAGQLVYQSGWLVPVVHHGVFAGMVVTLDDVTREKKAEEALRESEQNLRALLDSIEQMFVYIGADYRIRVFNRVWQENGRLFLHKETHIGDPILDFVAQEAQEHFLEDCRRALSGEIVRQEEVFETELRGTITAEVTYYPVRDEHGKVQGVGLNNYDITARKRSEEAVRAGRRQLQVMFEHIPVIIVAYDRNNQLLAWNKEAERSFGYSADEMVGHKDMLEIFCPDPVYREGILSDPRMQEMNYRDWEWAMTNRSGEARTISWSNLSGIVSIPGWHSWAIGIDVTQRRKAEQELEQKAAQLDRVHRLLQRLSLIGAELQKEPDHETLLQLLGRRLDESGIDCILVLRSPDSQALMVRPLSLEHQMNLLEAGSEAEDYPAPGPLHLAGANPDVFDYFRLAFHENQPVFLTQTEDILNVVEAFAPEETEQVRSLLDPPTRKGAPSPGATRAWAGLPLREQDETVGLLWLSSVDFQESDLPALTIFASHVAVALENARLHGELEQRAETDGLTGLYNRRRLMELGQSAVEQALILGKPLSAVMIDLDHFKTINDTFGHDTGDWVLREISQVCKRCIRDADFIGRYGGEEILIFLTGGSLAGSVLVAERIRHEIETWMQENKEGTIHLTASLGVAEFSPQSDDLKRLIQRADQALYRAKAAGRNRVEAA